MTRFVQSGDASRFGSSDVSQYGLVTDRLVDRYRPSAVDNSGAMELDQGAVEVISESPQSSGTVEIHHDSSAALR